MLKAQKTHLVTETDYHNKEERVKVIIYLPGIVLFSISLLTYQLQAVHDTVGNGIDVKSSTSKLDHPPKRVSDTATAESQGEYLKYISGENYNLCSYRT